MKCKLAVIGIFFLHVTSNAQSFNVISPNMSQPEAYVGLKSGAKLPAIKFSSIFDEKGKEVSFSDTKGKIVILEFWATWCGPCIPAMTHLANLKKSFAGQLEVVTISHESLERVERYIKKSPLPLWYTADPENTLQKYFPHHSIPHSVIVDQNNKIVAITSPDQITEKVISSLLEGKSVQLKEKEQQSEGFDFMKDYFPKPSGFNEFAFEIQPPLPGGMPLVRRNTNPSGEWYNRKITLINQAIGNIYKVAFEKSEVRTLYENGVTKEELRPGPNQKNIYCIDVTVPKGKENELKSFMINKLKELEWEYKCKIELRESDVLTLTCVDKQRLETFTSNSVTQSSSSGVPIVTRATNFNQKNATLSDLIKHLENFGIVKMPIVDETGLVGRYDINFELDIEDPQSLKKKMAEYGLQLQKEKKKVEMLIIYKE